MFDFNSLLGKPSEEDVVNAEFAEGFSEGVIMAMRLVEVIAKEGADKSVPFLNGIFAALREEL